MFTAIGSKVQISKTFGTAVTVSAISNADPAVVTATGHAFLANEEVLIQNGWDDITDGLFRVGTPDANTFQLQDCDSTDTEWYPAGSSSKGTARKISDWLDIGNITNIQSQGGTARTIDVRIISRRNSIKMPAGFESSQIDLELAYDPKRVDQKELQKISRKLSQRVGIKIIVPGGATIYGYGMVQMGALPTFNLDDILKIPVTLNIMGALTVYVDE